MQMFSPVEIPRNLKFKNNYYVAYSNKIKRNVKIFNELQYNNFLILEFNPNVIYFCEYPLKEYIEVNGRAEETVFHMYVEYKNGTKELQMISNYEYINDQCNLSLHKRRIVMQEQWCLNRGYEFMFISKNDINHGKYYLNNIRYLFGLIKRQDIPLLKRYLKIIRSKLIIDKLKIKDIFDGNIIPHEVIYATIALGIYEGQLIASIQDKVICYDTEVCLNNG